MANILFIDDEELVLNSLRRELRKFPHTLYFASSFSEATEILENNVINVLVTDMKMPDVNGLEVLKFIKVTYPSIVKIVLSGFAQITQVIATINHGDIFRFVKKPWTNNDQLIDALNDAIDYAAYLQNKVDETQNLEKRNKVYQKILSNFNTKKDRLELEIEFIKNFYSFYTSILSKSDFEHSSLERFKEDLMDCFPLKFEKVNCSTMNKKVVMAIEDELKDNIHVKWNYDDAMNIDIPIMLINTIIRYYISRIIEFNYIDSITLETTLNNTEEVNFVGFLIKPKTQSALNLGANRSYFDELFELFLPYVKLSFVEKENSVMLLIRYDFTCE